MERFTVREALRPAGVQLDADASGSPVWGRFHVLENAADGRYMRHAATYLSEGAAHAVAALLETLS